MDNICRFCLTENSINIEKNRDSKYGIIIVNSNNEIVELNGKIKELFKINDQDDFRKKIDKVTELKVISSIFDKNKEGLFFLNNSVDTKLINIDYLLENGKKQGSIISVREIDRAYYTNDDRDKNPTSINQLLNAFEASYDGVFITNNKGLVLKSNKAFEKICNLNKEEIKGLHVEKIYKLSPNDNIHFVPPVLQTIKSHNVASVAVKLLNKDLMITTSPILNEAGELTAVIGNVRDIGEYRKFQIHNQRKWNIHYSEKIETISGKSKLFPDIIMHSKSMQNIMETATLVSEFDSSVMIFGESGVGKEVVSKSIHSLSNRKDAPFIKVNCGAIPTSLFESEMFGYVEGAFTGAKTKGKKGYFEQADGGTLLLDEISELDYDMQVKLLRVIQESEIQRVGGESAIKVNVRILAATNKNLELMIEAGTFRADLYYRLNVVSIKIPSLRERKEDIIPLLNYFLKKLNVKYKKQKYFSKEIYGFLTDYEWPGNIRQLENLVENLMVLVSKDKIKTEHLPKVFFQMQIVNNQICVEGIMPLKKAVEIVEKQIIENAIKTYSSTKEVAQALGVDQSTIQRKIKLYLHK